MRSCHSYSTYYLFHRSVSWVYICTQSSPLEWVTLLYCFATNQGHCMLIKFTVDGLNRINAQAHNQHYSLNFVKWPSCEDDFIRLSNTAMQWMSLAVEPVTSWFSVREGPPSCSVDVHVCVDQTCCGKEIAREHQVIRKRQSSLSPHLFSSLAPMILHYC